MENMLDLLEEPQEVKDADNAVALSARGGRLEFDDVCFSYNPERPILKNVSFVAEPGQTVALVRESVKFVCKSCSLCSLFA